MDNSAGAGPRVTGKSIEDLPVVRPPENWAYVMPSFLARMAAEHGPIFRIDWRPDRRIVYLVGPEANRLVLHTHRQHFSHDQGWTPYLSEYFGHGLLNM